MGFTYSSRPSLPMCPVCDKARAHMGSSAWLPFEGNACSDECGMKAKQAIEALQKSPAWRGLRDRIWGLQDKLSEIEADAVAGIRQADNKPHKPRTG